MICETLSYNARKYLKNAWPINVFGCGNNPHQFYTPEGCCIGKGIMLTYNYYGICSIEDLNIAYTNGIEELKSGWTFSALKSNPYILGEAKWYFFIKKNSRCEECFLIQYLASKFGFLDDKSSLNSKIYCMCIKRCSGIYKKQRT